METLQPASRLHRTAISFVIGFGIFSLGAAIEGTLHAYNIHGPWEWVDNCVSALLTGMVVFAYEQRQHRKNLARLRVISDMNHHIRNALQPVLYAASGTIPQEQQKLIRDSVDRIQWALTEVLPSDCLAPHAEWPPQKY